MVYRGFAIYLAIIGIIAVIVLVTKFQQPTTPMSPPVEPAVNPYQFTVAAAGIVEATNENIAIGVPVAGLVTNVMVQVWDHVNEGQPLFQLDNRDLKAQLEVQKANVNIALASLLRLKDQLERLKSIEDPRAVSVDDIRTRENDVAVASAQLVYAQSQVHQTQALIDRLTIRAPKSGMILQNTIHTGEYVSLTPSIPPMVLGDLDHLQVRIDIDEQNASKIQIGDSAVAYPKNNTTLAIPLQFVRIEPYIIPKKSLTGSTDERVDTRVLQVIYSFVQPTDFQVYVGQQVDIFIKVKARKLPST